MTCVGKHELLIEKTSESEIQGRKVRRFGEEVLLDAEVQNSTSLLIIGPTEFHRFDEALRSNLSDPEGILSP